MVLLLAFSLLPAPAAAGTLPAFYADSLIKGSLNVPRSLDFLPSGDILVAENAGTVQLIQNGTARELLDVSSDVVEGGEQGLLGIAVDPDFPARPYVYFHYTSEGSTSYVQIARYTFLNASGPGPLGIDAGSKLMLIDDMPNNRTNHNGGTVRFGPDKNLYISIGDDAARACDAQNLTILAGKILRIKVDDTINPSDRATLAPLDNPFIASAHPNAKLVWALGLRNPFRFDIDPVDGRLYIGDVGQSAWEEVDVSAGGENFGWPYFEGNHTYPGGPCAENTATPASTLPIYDYPNPGGASVIMAALYRGVNYPVDWSLPPAFEMNPFFFDFSSGNLRVLDHNATTGQWSLVAGVSATNFGTGFSAVTDMQVGPDGGLYYLTVATNELRRIGYQAQPTIITDQLPSAEVGVAYSQTFVAGGNPGPYDWTLLSGTLPTGLLLDNATGELAGVPTAAGAFTFTIQVESAAARTANRSFVINVTTALQILTASLPDGMSNRSYSTDLSATGGLGPYAWAVHSGVLPSGLTVGSSTGTLSGTPAANGTISFEVSVTDAGSRVAFANLSVLLYAELDFGSSALPRGDVNMFYLFTFAGVGGTPPYTFSMVGGALPPGLSFDPSNATIWGTPTLEGVYDFAHRVNDSLAWNASRNFALVVAPLPGGPPVLATTALPSGRSGEAYNATLEVLGGTAPFVWGLTSGSLPPGLSLDAFAGVIAGNATAAGDFAFTMRVTDGVNRIDTRNLSIRIIAPVRSIDLLPLNVSVLTIGHSLDGLGISIAAVGHNTTLPISLSAAGLPPGVNLSASGEFSGAPTAAGNFSFVVTATDAAGTPVTANRSYYFLVLRIGIAPQSFGTVVVGTAVVTSLQGSNWTGDVAWSVTSGDVPPGLRLDANGTIRGTPTSAGSFTFTVEAREPGSLLNFDTRTFTIVVAGAPHQDPGSPFPWLLVLALVAVIAGALVYVAMRYRQHH